MTSFRQLTGREREVAASNVKQSCVRISVSRKFLQRHARTVRKTNDGIVYKVNANLAVGGSLDYIVSENRITDF